VPPCVFDLWASRVKYLASEAIDALPAPTILALEHGAGANSEAFQDRFVTELKAVHVCVILSQADKEIGAYTAP